MEELAKATGRTVGVINNFLVRYDKRNGNQDVSFGLPKDAVAKNTFKSSSEWKVLKKQFDKSELQFFLKKYNKFIAQFRGNVLPSEETQIIHLLKFEILMNRCMQSMKQNKNDIRRISGQIAAFNEKHGDSDLSDTQMLFLQNLEERLAGAKAGQSAKSSEYVKLEEKHISLMRELKATRDQRLEKIDEATKDFMGLIKALEETEFRETEGRQLELIKKAVIKEEQKLLSPVVFPNGEVDCPILNSESNIFKKEESNE